MNYWIKFNLILFCSFLANELPSLDDGFYQFLYVTRDKEVCGASMPFQIIMSPFQLKERSVDSDASENMDAGFLLVNNECDRQEKESSKQEKDSDTSELDRLEEEEYKHEDASVQRNVLSEEKKVGLFIMTFKTSFNANMY